MKRTFQPNNRKRKKSSRFSRAYEHKKMVVMYWLVVVVKDVKFYLHKPLTTISGFFSVI